MTVSTHRRRRRSYFYRAACQSDLRQQCAAQAGTAEPWCALQQGQPACLKLLCNKQGAVDTDSMSSSTQCSRAQHTKAACGDRAAGDTPGMMTQGLNPTPNPENPNLKRACSFAARGRTCEPGHKPLCQLHIASAGPHALPHIVCTAHISTAMPSQACIRMGFL